VPAIYDEWINEDGSEIEQELRLRIMPLTAVVKILPLGARRAIQPYVGGGLGVYFWRYSETGEFLATDGSLFATRSSRAARRWARCRLRRQGRVSESALIGLEADTSGHDRSVETSSAPSSTWPVQHPRHVRLSF